MRAIDHRRGMAIGIAAMAAIVVASNILVPFLFGQWLTWGAFTYPFAFLVTDLMNRLYGPGRARAGGSRAPDRRLRTFRLLSRRALASWRQVEAAERR